MSGKNDIVLLDSTDMQDLVNDSNGLDEKYPPVFNREKSSTLEVPKEERPGPRIRTYNLSEPLIAHDLITNFLHKWIPNAATVIEKRQDLVKVDLDLESFLSNLKRVYLYYYQLVVETYQKNKAEIDAVPPKNNHRWWYSQLLEYLSVYKGEKDVDSLFSLPVIEDGMLIDIENFRGMGLFLVILDPEIKAQMDKVGLKSDIPLSHYKVLPTLGDYGHFLPEPGFNLVKKYGLSYFKDSEISGFQIGHFRRIELKLEDGTHEELKFGGPVYFEILGTELDQDTMLEFLIDGIYLYGQLTHYFL